MPETRVYTEHRNWPLVRKASSVYETWDWFAEQEAFAAAIDDDVHDMRTNGVLPLPHGSTHAIGGTDPITSVLASKVQLVDIDGAVDNDMQEYVDVVQGDGVVYGGEITANVDGSIDVAAGVAILKNAAAKCSTTGFATFPAVDDIALVDGASNYIYVDYNSGTITTKATVTPVAFWDEDKAYLNTVHREGTTLHIANFEYSTASLSTVINRLETEEAIGTGQGLATRKTGIIVGNPSGLYLSLTAGTMWGGLKRKVTTEFDTSASSVFKYYYDDGAGGHTAVASQTVIDNLQYDDGTGTLATLGNNQYGVHWMYLDASSTQLSVVYGLDSYTLATAETATPPTDVPTFVSTFSILVGKITVQKSAATMIVESPFETPFSTTGVTAHTELSDVNADPEVQHMTSEEAGVVAGVVADGLQTAYEQGDTITISTAADTTDAAVLVQATLVDGGTNYKTVRLFDVTAIHNVDGPLESFFRLTLNNPNPA